MKKFVRFLVATIVIILAAVLILALAEPKDVVVKRSVMIKAPKDAVFDQMVNYKNWTHWSPWYKMDSGIKMTYTGTDGQAGAGYHWVGDEHKTGEGEIKTDAVNGTEMSYSMTFIKPHRGDASGTLKAEDTGGMTRAIWIFTMHTPFPLNAMNAFLNMDKMLGNDFENGLNDMKKYVESHAEAANGTVKEVDFPAHTYAGIRQLINFSDMNKFYGEAYGKLGPQLNKKISGPPVCVFYKWDTVNKQADLAAAFPVSDTLSLPKGTFVFSAGPAKAFMAVENGGYSNSMQIHTAIQKRLAEAGKIPAMILEEYISGPMQQPDSTKWITNIYYLVQ
jgi:hypothetical protein